MCTAVEILFFIAICLQFYDVQTVDMLIGCGTRCWSESSDCHARCNERLGDFSCHPNCDKIVEECMKSDCKGYRTSEEFEQNEEEEEEEEGEE